MRIGLIGAGRTGHEVVEVFVTGANRGAVYFGATGDVDETVAVSSARVPERSAV